MERSVAQNQGSGGRGEWTREIQQILSGYWLCLQLAHSDRRGPWGKTGDSATRQGGGARRVETMGQKPSGFCSGGQGNDNANVVMNMRKHPCWAHSVGQSHCFINSSLLLWCSTFWSILNSGHQETAMLPLCYAAWDNVLLLPPLLLLPVEGNQVECFCFPIIKIDMPSHLWLFFQIQHLQFSLRILKLIKLKLQACEWAKYVIKDFLALPFVSKIHQSDKIDTFR